MIEIIFVILILGILSMLAIPRFVGVSDEANSRICEAAIGTMNRTVGLNLWSKSIAEGRVGSVVVNTAEMNKNLPDYNATKCGKIIGLVPGEIGAEDGEYGSPRFVNDGNMTHAPKWEWVKK